ncbi:hypothetical protein C8A03DRAFT_39155 [Achaetomium macrosporum]|uniref:Ankyrin n=1 Tax=Achaetomium macrosporum TaxID=79813 RepID=A0AAN7C0R6_9PEZI|nr:hypothetical protein C8A03DRAFT_39155 [Achaetomium macrosporum]
MLAVADSHKDFFREDSHIRAKWLRLNSAFGHTGDARLTPLLCAIQGDRASTYELLLARGADPNAETEKFPFVPKPLYHRRITPLICAIHCTTTSRPSIVKALISAGARVNGVRSRTSPLTPPVRPLCEAVSAWHQSLEIVKLLIDNGADAKKRDDRGCGPLEALLDSTSVDVASLNDILSASSVNVAITGPAAYLLR